MNRRLSIAALLLGLCAFPASAIWDTNSNGMSDLWETAYNGDALFPSTDYPYGPQDDPDCDGWTNEQEAAAGTNPFDANPPDGHLQPLITHSPEVWVEVNGIPELQSPESLAITWPTIVGKRYTLMVSSDLIEWIQLGEATFISVGEDGSYGITLPNDDKLFWRVAVEDVDSDSDGLTNAEEAELGTDPDSPETLAGYPDMWLAENYLPDLLNGGLSTLDLDGDPDEDGLTNAQEKKLGTNPAVSDNPGIVQDSIRNGDFSIPSIDGTEANPGLNTHQKDTQPNWNYWAGLPEPFGERSWKAWTEPGGPNIEYQRLTGSADQYAELKAHPGNPANYGIKQQVGTRIGVTYLLVFDCRTRPGTDAANNNFSVIIDSEDPKPITFTAHTGWISKAISFKATDVITDISLVPDTEPNDTKGCLVDNVKLVLVDITVAFGLGPDPLGDKTSRELLEEYLDGIKLTHDDNVWAVNGKDAQGNEKIHGVEIANTQVLLVEALQKEGQTVVFDGHSNFGFGPDYGSNAIRRIADFTNFGSKYTDVPLDIRYKGSNPNPEEDPSNWGTQGYPFLGFADNEIPNAPTNYKPLPIDKLRFSPNDEGVGEGQVFTSQGLGFAMWHFKIGGSKRLMVNAPNTDIPDKLAYKRFFYNACNSGIDYIENFKHGEFIYTTNTCFVEKATKIFVQGIVEGNSSELIMPSLNQNGVGANNPPSPIYEFKSF